MPEETLFRFGAIREPEASPEEGRGGLRVLTYPAPERSVLQAQLAAASIDQRRDIGQAHLDSIGLKGVRLSSGSCRD